MQGYHQYKSCIHACLKHVLMNGVNIKAVLLNAGKRQLNFL